MRLSELCSVQGQCRLHRQTACDPLVVVCLHLICDGCLRATVDLTKVMFVCFVQG